MEKEFCIEDYMNRMTSKYVNPGQEPMDEFRTVCEIVESEFDKEWNETDDETKNRKLEREKKAMMGYEEETRFYKEKIREILRNRKLSDKWFPEWYSDLCEGVFAELYGLSGLAPWAYDMDEKYVKSSSAKLIGDRLYCLIDGKSCLQPQRISRRRRQKLKRTLLLSTPYERLEYGFHETYLHNGIRITIYSGERTKPDQDVMVFRKYVMDELSFGKLIEKKTIPYGAEKLFMAMIRAGFNVIFAGQVRSGKTTFMQIWQKHEDPELEGLAIATDPETPWHLIMPDAPIMQLIADGKELERITKSLLRGDNDYVLLEEMRDAAAFSLALDITSTGTMRSKATIHDNDGINVPYKMASKIHEKYGGDTKEIIAQIYKNFDYVIELCQMPDDKSRKVMKGIIEYSYDPVNDNVLARYICKYDFKNGKWRWNPEGGIKKLEKYVQQRKEIGEMIEIIGELASENPMEGSGDFVPAYYRG